MLFLNRSIVQSHPFLLVSPSPWPLYTSISLLGLTISAALSFHAYVNAEYNLYINLVPAYLLLVSLVVFVVLFGISIYNTKNEMLYKLFTTFLILLLLAVFIYFYINIVSCDSTNNWDLYLQSSPGDSGYTELPVPGRRCPACLERGETVWVIPGKCCPQCGTPVN